MPVLGSKVFTEAKNLPLVDRDFMIISGGSGGRGGHGPPGPVNVSHKKMASEGSRIDFMFCPRSTRSLDPLLITGSRV